MKKTMFSLLLAFGLHTLVAQSVFSPQQDVTVPASVKTRFDADYPKAVPTWTMDGKDYAALYYDPGNTFGRTVVYSGNGTVVRTSTEVGPGTYPLSINDYYMQHYPNESYSVWMNKESNGTISYYSVRKGKKIWFDKDGKPAGK